MGTENLSRLVAARRAELAYYSPYYFLRKFPLERQQDLFGTGAAARWEQEAGAETVATASAAGALIVRLWPVPDDGAARS